MRTGTPCQLPRAGKPGKDRSSIKETVFTSSWNVWRAGKHGFGETGGYGRRRDGVRLRLHQARVLALAHLQDATLVQKRGVNVVALGRDRLLVDLDAAAVD